MDPHLLNGVGQPCIEGLRQGENKQAGQETKAEGDLKTGSIAKGTTKHSGLSSLANKVSVINWLRADCNNRQPEIHQSSLLNSQSVNQSLRKGDNAMIGLEVR